MTGTLRTEQAGGADAARRRNRETVEAWLRVTPEDRLDRHLLYARDGLAQLTFTDVGHPIVVRGRDRLRRHGELSLKVLPDWRWFDTEVVATDDPDRFWVETTGEGEIRFPGYAFGHYRNHFLHSFRLADGEIVASREFTNPIEHMRALRIATPTIERDWIPT